MNYNVSRFKLVTNTYSKNEVTASATHVPERSQTAFEQVFQSLNISVQCRVNTLSRVRNQSMSTQLQLWSNVWQISHLKPNNVRSEKAQRRSVFNAHRRNLGSLTRFDVASRAENRQIGISDKQLSEYTIHERRCDGFPV